MKMNELTGLVIELCIKIHSTIGPGCFEKVYEELLYYELCKLGMDVRRQYFCPFPMKNFLLKMLINSIC